ncbi:MAG: hypothetical protein VKK04_17255 [Synechococcales bacterium]|nr:hypothetical protein [Synechococcales bacterium]
MTEPDGTEGDRTATKKAGTDPLPGIIFLENGEHLEGDRHPLV